MPPEGEDYWWFSTSEDYPYRLPLDHHAKCHGGGLVFADAVEHAKIEKHGGLVVVKTPESDASTSVQAVRVLVS